MRSGHVSSLLYPNASYAYTRFKLTYVLNNERPDFHQGEHWEGDDWVSASLHRADLFFYVLECYVHPVVHFLFPVIVR